MSIKELITTLDKELLAAHDEYNSLIKTLNVYAMRELDGMTQDERAAAADIVNAIQDKMAEMHPALHWIAYRTQLANNLADHYTLFIDSLKKSVTPKEARA